MVGGGDGMAHFCVHRRTRSEWMKQLWSTMVRSCKTPFVALTSEEACGKIVSDSSDRE